MAKLTKAQRKAHAEAEAILTKDRLSDDEKQFVFENWHEGAEHINGAMGAFFTPYDLAADFGIDAQCSNGRMIDLCAGIGILSYFPHYRANGATTPQKLPALKPTPVMSRLAKSSCLKPAGFVLMCLIGAIGGVMSWVVRCLMLRSQIHRLEL